MRLRHNIHVGCGNPESEPNSARRDREDTGRCRAAAAAIIIACSAGNAAEFSIPHVYITNRNKLLALSGLFLSLVSSNPRTAAAESKTQPAQEEPSPIGGYT